MRLSILLVRNHGEELFTLLAGPEVPIATQEHIMREHLILGNVHPEVAEIQRWEPDYNIFRSQKFVKPEDAKAALDKVKADQAAHQKLMDNPALAAKLKKAADKKAADELAANNKKKHEQVTDEAAKAKKAADELAAINVEAHQKATLEMAQRRAKADLALAEMAGEKVAVINEEIASLPVVPPLEVTAPVPPPAGSDL